ncbi:MAG: 4a-hydroxytetrahydrobiopterin dehydratase [Proteobacteria bacterium]|nr:4a-hydroxytetrahydrobiopterin dehydratase [Pseudomonadota bacterium]
MSGLTAKACVPCRGGVPPLTEDQAKRYLGETPNWALDGAATRIERRFAFGDFVEALDFVNRVGALAEEQGHHPDISFGWGYCNVVLYTHKIKGLHENDFIMAAKIDQLE